MILTIILILFAHYIFMIILDKVLLTATFVPGTATAYSIIPNMYKQYID